MTKITDYIWIGDSTDAEESDLRKHGVTAILCVAHDLQCRRGWSDGILYAQCGLVDGPGSNLAAYHSAVLQLVSIVSAGRKVMVVDHVAGGRAVAVTIMALHVGHSKLGWEHWLGIINEKMERKEFNPHQEHRNAFNRTNWRLLSSIL